MPRVCWTVTVGDGKPHSIYAFDAREAAETATARWGEVIWREGSDGTVTVTVERDGDCRSFRVWGEMALCYRACEIEGSLDGERFQARDRVQIWDRHSTLHGQVGTVVQADEQRYQYAMVLVDGAELPQWWPCAKLRRVEVSDDEAVDGTGMR